MTEIQDYCGCVCAVSCEILFGLSYLFTKKIITSDVDAVTLLGWRFLLAFIMMNILLITGYININIKRKLIFAKDSRSSTDSLFYMRDVWDR